MYRPLRVDWRCMRQERPHSYLEGMIDASGLAMFDRFSHRIHVLQIPTDIKRTRYCQMTIF